VRPPNNSCPFSSIPFLLTPLNCHFCPPGAPPCFFFIHIPHSAPPRKAFPTLPKPASLVPVSPTCYLGPGACPRVSPFCPSLRFPHRPKFLTHDVLLSSVLSPALLNTLYFSFGIFTSARGPPPRARVLLSSRSISPILSELGHPHNFYSCLLCPFGLLFPRFFRDSPGCHRPASKHRPPRPLYVRLTPPPGSLVRPLLPFPRQTPPHPDFLTHLFQALLYILPGTYTDR